MLTSVLVYSNCQHPRLITRLQLRRFLQNVMTIDFRNWFFSFQHWEKKYRIASMFVITRAVSIPRDVERRESGSMFYETIEIISWSSKESSRKQNIALKSTMTKQWNSLIPHQNSFYFNFGKGHYFVLRLKQHFFGKARFFKTNRLNPAIADWREREVDTCARRLPVVSYPWIFRTQTIRAQAQTFRTHLRSVRTQPSGRFVPNKLWPKMFKTNINIYFIYPSNRKKANF